MTAIPATNEIQIPFEWEPRAYQRRLFNFIDNGGLRAVAVWHRRGGKDSVAVNIIGKKMFQRIGTYWHMAPKEKQARKIIWDGIGADGKRIIDQAFPKSLRTDYANDEMKIRMVGGSVFQVLGSDNYDSQVGTNPIGVVFSEWALCDPKAWDYIRPILAENGGWAIFIYTARGRNHGFELYNMARKNQAWFCEVLSVEDTGAIRKEVIQAERDAGMPEEMIQQEFFCSFQAGVVGAYYGREIEACERDTRIATIPWQPDFPVSTFWNLDATDSVSVIFAQFIGQKVHCIDYIEKSGVGLDWYAKEIDRRPYKYADHVAPHEAEPVEEGSGVTRVETLRSLGLKIQVLQKQSLQDGINAARIALARTWFDETKCARLVAALQNYHRDWDEKKRVYSIKPERDEWTQAADAYRALALHKPAPTGFNKKIAYPKMAIA